MRVEVAGGVASSEVAGGRERPAAAGSLAGLRAHQLERRERIIRAAIELLEVREYDKVQIRDVAEQADTALATVYRYFASKEQLYAAAAVQWSADFFERIQVRGDDGGTDEERLRRILRRTVRALERWPQFIRALMILARSSDESVRAYLDEYQSHYNNMVAMCLRDLTPATAADVLMVIGSVYDRATRDWAIGRRTVREVERELDRAIDLVFEPLPD